MSAVTANVFNINITENDVRITLFDQRPEAKPNEYGHPPPSGLVTTEKVAEAVISHSLFRQMLDAGDRLLAQVNANSQPKAN